MVSPYQLPSERKLFSFMTLVLRQMRTDGNSVGDLANDGASRANGRRLDIGTSEAVDDDSDDDVKRTSASLQHAQSLGEISGVLHLRNETEVGDVGTEGNKDVGDGYNTSAERGHARRSDCVSVGASRRIDSDANHSNEDGSRDGQARSNGHEGDVLHGSWNAEDHGNNHANDSENNGASSVVGKDVQHDGESQDVSGHDEDQEDDLSGFRDLLEPSSEEEEASVGKVVNSRESNLDLVGDISGVCCEDTEEDNEDATRDEAHAGNDSRKREDTQRDGLSNEEETGIEPCHGLISLWNCILLIRKSRRRRLFQLHYYDWLQHTERSYEDQYNLVPVGGTRHPHPSHESGRFSKDQEETPEIIPSPQVERLLQKVASCNNRQSAAVGVGVILPKAGLIAKLARKLLESSFELPSSFLLTIACRTTLLALCN
ncbi:putative amino acid transporter, partial [Aureobasidium melanogenum]